MKKSHFEMQDCHSNLITFHEIFILDSRTVSFAVSDPCQLVDIETAMEDTGVMWHYTTIKLSYQSLGMIEDKEGYLFSFNAFVSAVGGNLGLFLGFSILTAILDLLDLIEKMIEMIKRRLAI